MVLICCSCGSCLHVLTSLDEACTFSSGLGLSLFASWFLAWVVQRMAEVRYVPGTIQCTSTDGLLALF